MTCCSLNFALAILLAMTQLVGCDSGLREEPTVNYFPLMHNSTWIYQITNKSRGTQYRITDHVVDLTYMPSIKAVSFVVDESCSLACEGGRPLMYYAKDGYLSRVSPLRYDGEKIDGSSFGRSEEAQFLPVHLMPNMIWSNVTYPYAGLFGSSFGQKHRTFAENKLIEVPAGRFSGCIRVETQATRKDAHGGRRDFQLSYIDWYAPSVGLVKTLALEGGPEGLETERVELIRFRITSLPIRAGGH
jgi:hypothetical protein